MQGSPIKAGLPLWRSPFSFGLLIVFSLGFGLSPLLSEPFGVNFASGGFSSSTHVSDLLYSFTNSPFVCCLCCIIVRCLFLASLMARVKYIARLLGADKVDPGADAGVNIAGGREAVADVPV